jgi:hypothetical protein
VQDLRTEFRVLYPSTHCLLSSDPNHMGLRFALPGLPGPESSLGSYLWLCSEPSATLPLTCLDLGSYFSCFPGRREGSGWGVRAPGSPSKDRRTKGLTDSERRGFQSWEKGRPYRALGPEPLGSCSQQVPLLSLCPAPSSYSFGPVLIFNEKKGVQRVRWERPVLFSSSWAMVDRPGLRTLSKPYVVPDSRAGASWRGAAPGLGRRQA